MSTIEQIRSGGDTGDGGGIAGRWQSARTFLVEVRNEMRRVTWPSRREVYATTIVVLLVSAFFGVYLYVLDLLFDGAINWVFRLFGAA